MSGQRRRAIGAEVVRGGVSFRVWAPHHRRLDVVIDDGSEFPLDGESSGYFCGLAPSARAGTRYRFRIDGQRETYPDPASRYQPDGPHGASEVIDAAAFEWTDGDWRGPSLCGAVIYEMHVGTFTREGTFTSAARRLQQLADDGITIVEVMPVNEFAGSFGWGYDGVDLWAPTRLYGHPDDFRRFVDSAHQLGLAVILDVVYNHLGPDGCYLSKFTPSYFTKKYTNEWGESVNFDDENCAGSREFFVENAAYWIDEFHIDGLRLDATQSVNDASERHILSEINDAVRNAAIGRNVILVAENEPQDVRLLKEYGVDALWNDDWHHASRVALTGKSEAYYTDYLGRPQEFISMAKFGFLYQGQRYRWQKKRRGTPSIGIEPQRFVCYLQNHDQVANSATGARLHELTSPARLRAMTALLLLQPQTPMLFQGQEFASSSPFLYFADHNAHLAPKVAEGRRDFLKQFPSIETVLDELAPPDARSTFERCKLDFAERERNAHVVTLHRDLIRLRRTDPTISQQRTDILHGAVIGEEAFVLRWIVEGSGDRLLVINLGRELRLDPAPELLLAPPANHEWEILWSSESAEYGGAGTPPLDTEENWRIPAQAAVLLQPRVTRI